MVKHYADIVAFVNIFAHLAILRRKRRGIQPIEIYVMTMVERATSCIVGWCVGYERTEAVMQSLVDAAPQAAVYFRDDFSTYSALIYTPGTHIPMHNKSQTDHVEGDNAQLRHYLARLWRRSRCFSCSIPALQRAIKLFVYAWNRRQLYKQRYPKYPISSSLCHHDLMVK
jgi:IS1 family transposase